LSRSGATRCCRWTTVFTPCSRRFRIRPAQRCIGACSDGISRLPDIEGDKPKRQRFKRYPIGFFHMDIAEVQTAEGKLYLFVAIDRTSKFAVTQLVEKADRTTAWEFLERLLKAVPYRIHTILTDNGIQFADQPRDRTIGYDGEIRPNPSTPNRRHIMRKLPALR